ncbi:hypothetical protein AAFF_G00013470 [Aldrovandia affinis]|uniref:Zona pellucida sperm-binding protein 3 n=1 Tax=Aldrovandia affinis TaxID=143900 RepID=A0AAD7WH96_9TELE|nr:hypothetical protein AAFF_G00013470 [Aldrovandia affinis]
MDLFGIRPLIQPSDITLGGCWPTGQDGSAQVLVFETGLQDCGSTLMDSLINDFALIYEPDALGATPIVRTNGAVVHIECHYMRPIMCFSVFVDRCMATMEPNMDAVPKYTFIENHGCLTDAKLTGSHSTFLPRIQDDKLYFQLDAFRFFQELHLHFLPPESSCSFCSAQWEGNASLCPIYVHQTAANDMVPESQTSPLKPEDHRAASIYTLYVEPLPPEVECHCRDVL